MPRLLVGALLVAGCVACGPGRPQSAAERPDVLLITIDTFRADRLNPQITPSLDRLAAASTRFTTARATVPLTLPSHTTIMTGLFPPAHGVRENGIDRLADTHDTIASLLKQRGYRTAAFVGAFVLDRRFGLARGFDTYDDEIARDPQAVDRLEAERPADVVVDHALAWLNGGAAAPAPFFVWIHVYDAHAPYAAPAEFGRRFAQPYDGELSYVDSQISRVIEWMRARKTRPALIIVAGDHGESLGDHGEATHGMLLYDATLRVPLIVSAPGLQAGVRTEAVTLADVAPTILDAARTSHGAMDGQSLLTPSKTRTIYSETEYPRGAGWSALQSLADDRWKLVKGDTSSELYDLRSDPAEHRNVWASESSVAAAMAGRIEAIWKARSAAPSSSASNEAMERVRALGYVSTGAAPIPSGTADNPADHISDWNAFEQALAGVTARDAASLTTMIRLAQKYPDAAVIQTTLARATKDAGSPMAALRIYRRAAGRWPTDPTILHDLAVAARDAARQSGSRTLRDEAAAAEQAAVALDAKYAPAFNGLGLIAVDEGRAADAVRSFERATSLDPTNASYFTNLGNARRDAGDRSGAEQAYTRALAIDKSAADAANGLGVLLVESGKAADAVAWFERALATAPGFVDARLNLGIALQQSGNAVGATQTYREVLRAPVHYARQRDAATKLLAGLEARRPER